MNYNSTNSSVITLTDSLFLGQGKHKAVYVHPANPKLCIKVPFQLPDSDIEKELKYRDALQGRPQKHLLTNYYGQVLTNKGPGFVFDNVCDYDGCSSISLEQFLQSPQHLCRRLAAYPFEILRNFRRQFLRENIVVSDTDPVNIFIQLKSDRRCQFKIIDNIGSPTAIPFAYYIEFVAALRARRYWKRFVATCKKKSPHILSDVEWRLLL